MTGWRRRLGLARVDPYLAALAGSFLIFFAALTVYLAVKAAVL